MDLNNRHTKIKAFNADVPRLKNEKEWYEKDVPTIKYLMITKVYEKQINRHRFTKLFKKRIYGIGILTSMNEYYYNEIKMSACDMSYTTARKLASILTLRFKYTKDTRIQIIDRISFTKEPIMIFLRILCGIVRIPIKKKSYIGMLKSLNNKFKYIVPTDKKKFKFAKVNQERMVRQLLKNNRFEFIQDEEWRYKLHNMKKRIRTSNLECAVGILYMFVKDINREYIKTYNLKKSIEQKEEPGIITSGKEEKENET